MSNEMRWDCKRQECFNVKKRPKLEVFSDCFDGKISMGDLDGIVEIAGNFLCVDFKASISRIGEYDGQVRMLKRMSTIPGWSVAFIECDAETMVCSAIRWVVDGEMQGTEAIDTDGVKALFASWCEYAKMHPVPHWLLMKTFHAWQKERNLR
jgi:hypothetical protein